MGVQNKRVAPSSRLLLQAGKPYQPECPPDSPRKHVFPSLLRAGQAGGNHGGSSCPRPPQCSWSGFLAQIVSHPAVSDDAFSVPANVTPCRSTRSTRGRERAVTCGTCLSMLCRVSAETESEVVKPRLLVIRTVKTSVTCRKGAGRPEAPLSWPLVKVEPLAHQRTYTQEQLSISKADEKI